MTGTWDEETPPTQCGGCGAENVMLFHIPGGWGWADDTLDGRIGLCIRCGTTDERYKDVFREHFGDIRFISDSDVGHSADKA